MMNEWLLIRAVTEICLWLSQCLSTVIQTFLKEKNMFITFIPYIFYLWNKHVGTEYCS